MYCTWYYLQLLHANNPLKSTLSCDNHQFPPYRQKYIIATIITSNLFISDPIATVLF